MVLKKGDSRRLERQVSTWLRMVLAGCVVQTALEKVRDVQISEPKMIGEQRWALEKFNMQLTVLLNRMKEGRGKLL